jgi:hypothetical protein
MDTHAHIITETSHVPVTEYDFCLWLSAAEPGDILQYHRGFLALDVSPSARRLNEHQRKALIRVARRARWAAENELVHLIQRRYGIGDYGYIVEARPRPEPERKSLLGMLIEAS